MAPPELGSQSEDSSSQQETTPLEYIEQALRTLRKNTLEIKKRNDEIIKNISVPCSTSSSLGWKGSPIDVPSVPSTIQCNKAGHPSKSRASLNIDVEKVLQESSKLKERINETLRLSEVNREQNQKYMQELRQESIRLSAEPSPRSLMPCPHTSLALTHSVIPGGILTSLKTAFKKLGGDKSVKGNQTEAQKASQIQLTPTELCPRREVSSQSETLIQLFDENDSTSNNVPPPIKPRTKRLQINKEQSILQPQPIPRPRIRRPQLAPQPQSPAQITLQDFKKMYENVSSDEEPPIPGSTLPRQDSSLSESASEIEYIISPVIYNVLDDDGSLIISKTGKSIVPDKPPRFQKNQQSTKQVGRPRPHKKNARSEGNPELEQLLVPQQPIKKPKQKMRPSSPPPLPLQLTRVVADSVVLSHLSEEDLTASSNDEELPHSVIPEVQHFPCAEKAVFCNNEVETEGKSRTSALRSGVSIQQIEVPVRPFLEPEISTNYKIQASPFHLAEIAVSSVQQLQGDEKSLVQMEKAPKNENEIETNILENKIDEQFLFLDNIKFTEVPPTVSSSNSVCSDTIIDIDDIASNDTFEKSCRYHQILSTVTEPTNEINANIASNNAKMCPNFEDIEESLVLEKAHVILDQSLSATSQLPLSEPPTDLSSHSDSPPPFVPPPAPPMPPLCNTDVIAFSTLPIVPLDEMRYKGTIFNTLEPVDLDLLKLDMAFMEENFLQATSPETEKRRSSVINNKKWTSDNVDPIMLLSTKWKQAIEIGTRNIDQSKTDIFIDAIKTLNSANISTEEVQILQQMVPKDNEGLAFANFNKEQVCTLPVRYNFVKSLVEIPRLRKKLKAINFLLNFGYDINCLESQITILQTATESVKNSENFRQILRVILTIANQFVKNGKEVKAFQIQSLDRLAKKKSPRPGMSLLNYIVERTGETMPQVIRFYDDFKCIDDASKISLKDVEQVLKELDEEIKSVQSEMLATEEDFVDGEILCNLKKSQQMVDTFATQHQTTCQQWRGAVQNLKKLVEYFGMSNTSEKDLVDFFHIIQHFVGDFKHALYANEKLFAPVLESEACTDSLLRKRSPKDSCNDHPDTKAKKRQSLGFNNLNLSLEEESGQPREFVDAMIVLGASALSRSPPRKDEKEDGADIANRRRRKLRTSKMFVIADNNRER